jgi:hypothetical protein
MLNSKNNVIQLCFYCYFLYIYISKFIIIQMKKHLLTIFGTASLISAVSQVSPSWTINQNAAWPIVSAGTRFLDAVNPNVVWAIGYDGASANRNYNWFTRTINGGATYTSGVVYSGTNAAIGDTNTYRIANLEGIDANTAWVSSFLKSTPQSKGAIHRTTDGGATWVNMTATGMYTNTNSFCNIVTFITPSIGITMGDAHPGVGNEFEIWRTINGGNSWTLIPGANIPDPSTANEFGLVNVYCKQGTSNIWFGTNEGRVFRSTNGGLNWNVATLPSTPINSVSVNDIAFSTPLNGIAIAFNASTAQFEEFNTSNGGATWTQIVAIDPNLGLNDICAIPTTSYYASVGAGAGNQIISYSTDNGVTWVNWGGAGIQYLTVDFADGQTGWAGSFSNNATIGAEGIYKYTDALITSPTPPTAAFAIPPIVCFSGTGVTVTPSNSSTGTNPITYSWSATAGAVVSAPTASLPNIIFTTTGTFTITLSVTNGFGTNTSSQQVVVQNCTAPTSSFSIPTSTCNNTFFATTNGSTGSPTPTYSWSTSAAIGVTISPSSISANPTIKFATPGVYSVTLLSSNSQGTATSIQTITINNCAPTTSFNITSTGCTSVAMTTTNQTTGATPISYFWTVSPSSGVSPILPSTVASSVNITINNIGVYTISLTATNSFGSTSFTKTVNVSSCVGLNENTSFADLLEVYPNPSKDLVNVNLSGNNSYNVTVTDILGAVVYSKTSNTEKLSINLSNKAKGIYFITVEVEGKKATKKIIVE